MYATSVDQSWATPFHIVSYRRWIFKYNLLVKSMLADLVIYILYIDDGARN